MKMDSNKEVREVDQFLSKVKQIETIIKGLNAEDDEEQKKANEKADKYLEKLEKKKKNEEENKGFDRTVINTLPSSSPSPPVGPTTGNIDQAGFMEAMERDAKERSDRRKINEKEAEKLKLLGNEEFKKENYEKALDYYDQAMDKIRDNQAIYTNRAQTRIKLGMYKEAISDCDWALRISNNAKAHVHMARAYLHMKEFDKARECFKNVLTADPKKTKMVEDYLSEVDHEEDRDKQVSQAQELFNTGDEATQNLVDVMEKVQKSDKLPLYYSGGFRVIFSLLSTENDKTIFRTKGGVDFVKTHPMLSRCFKASPQSLNREEQDVLDAAINMYIIACTDNDFNKEELMKKKEFTEGVTQLLQAKVKGHWRVIKRLCIQLLQLISTSKFSRSLIVTQFNLSKLLTCVFHQIKTSTSSAKTSAALLKNLALDDKFKSVIRDTLDDQLLPAFETLMKDGNCQQAVLPTCLGFMTNLSIDTVIRKKLSTRTQIWQACIQLMETHKSNLNDEICMEILTSSIGLLCNLSKEDSSELTKFSLPVSQHCLTLLKIAEVNSALQKYSSKLLSHILPQSQAAVTWSWDHEAPPLFIKLIKEGEESVVKDIVRCLTACTQTSSTAREYIVHNKGLGALVDLVKNGDELAKGNAALCLSHCLQVPKAGAALTKTDLVKDLLVLARDSHNDNVRQNSAILLSKLAQSDKRHLERLRELHGVEILNDCMKFIK